MLRGAEKHRQECNLMKRLLAITLALALAFTLCPALSESAEEKLEEKMEETPMAITVGVPTKMSGFFFTSKWGINHGNQVCSRGRMLEGSRRQSSIILENARLLPV